MDPAVTQNLVSGRGERAAPGWAAVMLVAPLAGVAKDIAGRPGPMAASRRRLRAAPAGPLLFLSRIRCDELSSRMDESSKPPL